ncbi:MAG: YccF domain-containing protein [Tidjanibacter sp.]|nr:YccF domain-containing protein [Tidjanibacter sp.]MBR6831444.1 YccF domain-containing protein [Tidjanibacter sp.]
MFKFLGNILWIIFGGLCVAVEYATGAIAACMTIVGIPFGMQLFKLAVLALWPFGNEVAVMSGKHGCLHTIFNIIWLFTGGLCIALTHLAFGLLLCITIVGIPFGKQHFKLMKLAFTPFGRAF